MFIIIKNTFKMAENSETSAIIEETQENPTIQEVPISSQPTESSASERAQPLEPSSSSAEAPKRRGRPAGTKDAIKRERKPKPKPVKATAPSSDTSPSPVATPPSAFESFRAEGCDV